MVDGAADGFFTEGNEVNEDGTDSRGETLLLFFD